MNHLKNINHIRDNFRPRFFAFGDDQRQEKRVKRLELKEIGKLEAIKRGKQIVEEDVQS